MSMKTTLYLIRHAEPELSFTDIDPPLTRLGVRQAELTRDFLAVRPVDCCYSSPTRRAMQTASIIAAPYGLAPFPLESLGSLHRLSDTIDALCVRHAGNTVLVVAHQDCVRRYLTNLLGMSPEQAGQVQLDSCGISVVVRDGADTTVSTLNASFHLQGIAA
jgi:broad specificity phosphatase PhoE